MKTFYFQYIDEGNGNGNVAFYSEASAQSDNFSEIQLDVSDDDYALMRQNYLMRIEDGELILTASGQVVQQVANQNKQTNKVTLQGKIDNDTVTIQDVANLLITLL